MSYTLTEKGAPVEADGIIIKDSEDDGNVKCIALSQLPRIFQVPQGDGSAPVGGQTVYFAQWGAYSVLNPAERRLPKCIVKRFTMNVSTNTVNSSTTFTIQKNGVDTGLELTYAADETGRKTVTVDVPFAEGDLISCKAVIGGNPAQAIYTKDMVADAVGVV